MNPSGGAMCHTGAESDHRTLEEARWYVLETKRHRERLAQKSLAEIGVASYLPLVAQWPRPVVGSDIGPMFPGYLFVYASLNEEFSRISWTPGVKSFVTFGGAPAPLDASAIDYLRSREDADGVIRSDSGVREQSQVRIVHGPFRGLTAVVEQRLSARERVRVLMHILQRTTLVELPERWVART
ncbi:MAG: transcription termination/antitermination protein NusG [Candidatus Binatia bacterium]